ncbi:hypothetical protein [Taibaiella koreensis]|uniref:hypothetical protein n=1 Tax=Taibaiella koreensis TaxID=1268548 RepID=UPI0013C31450|nr:hypothetical protein [Taibaiella koreensis]
MSSFRVSGARYSYTTDRTEFIGRNRNLQDAQKDMKLIALLESAFDTSGLNPYYIKGYVPGVRENGAMFSCRHLDIDPLQHRQSRKKSTSCSASSSP